jgi:hypothetical protein
MSACAFLIGRLAEFLRRQHEVAEIVDGVLDQFV